MLRAAIIFFVIGLFSYLLGLGGVAGLSIDIAKTIMLVFVVLAIITAVTGVFLGRKTTGLL